jgi:hypothetical protein
MRHTVANTVCLLIILILAAIFILEDSMDITLLPREKWVSSWETSDKLIEEEGYLDIEDLENPLIYDEAEALLIQYIIDNKVILSGSEHQYKEHGIPVFDSSDGKRLAFRTSMRHWGSIMAHAWNKIKGYPDVEDEEIIRAMTDPDARAKIDGSFNYCSFAWTVPSELDENRGQSYM